MVLRYSTSGDIFVPHDRVRTDFGKCQKVVEIDNAIFQDLDSFGKRGVFQHGCGNVLDFCFGKF